jgi:hypothetical protein
MIIDTYWNATPNIDKANSAQRCRADVYDKGGGLNWGYPQQYYLNRHHPYKSATYSQSGENYLSFVNYFVTLAVAR